MEKTNELLCDLRNIFFEANDNIFRQPDNQPKIETSRKIFKSLIWKKNDYGVVRCVKSKSGKPKLGYFGLQTSGQKTLTQHTLFHGQSYYIYVGYTLANVKHEEYSLSFEYGSFNGGPLLQLRFNLHTCIQSSVVHDLCFASFLSPPGSVSQFAVQSKKNSTTNISLL